MVNEHLVNSEKGFDRKTLRKTFEKSRVSIDKVGFQ